jgi:hypothetical protein
MPYVPVSNNYEKSAKLPKWALGGVFRNVQGASLSQIHIYATLPAEEGYFSDGHVTLQFRGSPSKHYYYQVNNGRLVSQYGQRTPWTSHEGFQNEAETEILALIQYYRPAANGLNNNVPVFNQNNYQAEFPALK